MSEFDLEKQKVAERLARLEVQQQQFLAKLMEVHGEMLKRCEKQDRTLYGNGQMGLTTHVALLNKFVWGAWGVLTTLAVAVFLGRWAR